MFRSAAVALKPDEENDALLDYAITLAGRYKLRLTGIVILDRDLVSGPEPVPLGGMVYKVELDEALLAIARKQAAAALSTFAQRCQAANVSCETTSSEDSLGPELAQAVQRHDLLLVGHTTRTAPKSPGSHSALQTILRRCPRPAIVVPGAVQAGDRIVVAYDGSVQAARALASFIASGFETDSPIDVVAFHEVWEVAEEAASIARSFLESHEYRVFARPRVISADESIAEMIKAACVEHRARLLIMGAYGKAVIKEFFFGSTTKSLLAEAALPILLDH